MVRSHQPGFQIRENEVNDRPILFGNLGIAAFGDCEVIVSTLGEAGITTPVISHDLCARRNRSLNEAATRLSATIRYNGEPNTTGVPPTLALVEFGPRRSRYDLNSSGNKDFVVDAPTFSAGSPSDIAFVDFDIFTGFSADSILIGTHHSSTKLMENLKGRLVTGEAKLPLKLYSRHARRLTGNQIGRPKPDIQRRMRTFYYRPHRQSCVASALAASKDAGATGKSKGVAYRRTRRADESTAPTQCLQVPCARLVVRETSLEFWKRARKRKIVALMNVHDLSIVPLIFEGNNRIGMVQWSRECSFTEGLTSAARHVRPKAWTVTITRAHSGAVPQTPRRPLQSVCGIPVAHQCPGTSP